MRTLYSLLLAILSISALAQDITGKWTTTTNQYRREAYIGNDFFFIEVYYGDTQIKMHDSFLYMQVNGDQMKRSPQPLKNDFEVRTYTIEEVSQDQLKISENGESTTVTWQNINHEIPDRSPVNYDEYYFNGAIACVSKEGNAGPNNCLNFKKIDMNTTRTEIESMFGEPYQVVEQEGVDNFVYLVPDQEQDSPYFVIMYDEDETPKMLQLTGNIIDDEYAFSGIRLGDAATYIRKRLGEPSRTTEVENGLLLWDYSPFPISFELKGGRVYSIRLSQYEN